MACQTHPLSRFCILISQGCYLDECQWLALLQVDSGTYAGDTVWQLVPPSGTNNPKSGHGLMDYVDFAWFTCFIDVLDNSLGECALQAKRSGHYGLFAMESAFARVPSSNVILV